MATFQPQARPVDRGAAGGLLGGLGGVVTCLCCISALALLGLWGALVPFVAFFRYAYEQETSAFGGSPGIQNLQQIAILLAVCLLTIRFIKWQMNT